MKKWFKEIDNMRMFVNKSALKKCNKILGNVMSSYKVEVHLVQDPPPGDWTGY